MTLPLVAHQWHPTRNVGLFADVTPSSSKRVWWLGDCGHEWERVVREQAKRGTCPYCSGARILAGFNDLGTLRPDIAAEWHPTKNDSTPAETALMANKKVWWTCPVGHDYQTALPHRTVRNHGCPFCANKQVMKGFNDLASQFPEVAKQWSSKNTKAADTVAATSHAKVWWSCELGHEWETEVRKRTARGQGCPVCAGNVVKVGFNDFLSLYPEVAVEWAGTNPNTPDMYTAGSEHKADWTCDKGHNWKSNINNRTLKKARCPKCVAGEAASKAETAVGEYLESLGLKVDKAVRSVIKPFEIDLYVEERKIGIEFNGIYWHNETHKGRTYHRDKWLAAKEAGVQLIQIWEDEWNRNPEQIKVMLAHKLGVSNEQRVSGRNTIVKPISAFDARVFMDKHHIQGFASGTHYLSLQDKKSSQTVAVLTLRKEDKNGLNIIRYATSVHVIAGFTKLLSYATKNFNPSFYVTFADHCVSDGRLYEANGFVVDKELPPDYMYVVKNERKHKFGYRLKKFRDDPTLIWDENLSESQLAKLNGLNRIWDAGKTRYRLDISNPLSDS
jgi:hypothetical protein